MELIHEMTFDAVLKPLVRFGDGPAGSRVFGEVIGGRVAGPRISGRVLTGGGDWAVVGTDGIIRLDVRIQFETHDGAQIFVQYFGVLDTSSIDRSVRDVGFDDMYLRTTPRFETGDERYAWLTRHVFVGEGRRTATGVEYRVYRV